MKNSKIQTTYFLIFLVLLLFNSCDTTNPTVEIKVNDFPNKIGNKWTYFYHDSLNNISDTLIVEVIGDTTIAVNRIAMIWEYKFNNYTKYKLVETYNDSVIFYMNTHDYLLEYYKIVFPLSLNKSWGNSNRGDSSFVTSKEPIIIMAGDYWNCYKIYRPWILNNDFIFMTIWFVPNLGIAKKHSLGPSKNNYWELMEWDIK